MELIGTENDEGVGVEEGGDLSSASAGARRGTGCWRPAGSGQGVSWGWGTKEEAEEPALIAGF